MTEKTMAEIIGVDYDLSTLPEDRSSSMDPNAVNYRRALARASNAIEGVILSDEDKAFMNTLDMSLPKEERDKLILDYVKNKEW